MHGPTACCGNGHGLSKASNFRLNHLARKRASLDLESCLKLNISKCLAKYTYQIQLPLSYVDETKSACFALPLSERINTPLLCFPMHGLTLDIVFFGYHLSTYFALVASPFFSAKGKTGNRTARFMILGF